METPHARKRKNRNKNIAAAAAAFAATAALLIFGAWCNITGRTAESGMRLLYDNARRHLGLVDNSADVGIAVHFLDVGEGDCALVICGGKSMLIDAGVNGCDVKIASYLRHCGIEKLDYAVATHPHADHIGSLDEIITEFLPAEVVLPGITHELEPKTIEFADFTRAVEKSGAHTIYAIEGRHFDLGGARVTVLAPVKIRDDLNDDCLVLRVDYGDVSFLFAADAGETEENDILKNGGAENCDVLKVGHHGAADSSGEAFVSAVNPFYAVISVGAGNDYGHPAAGVTQTLLKFAARIYRTDINGDIIISSDGKEIFAP